MKPWDLATRIRSNVANADRNPLSAQEQLEVAEYLVCLSRIHAEMKGFGGDEPFDWNEALQEIDKHLIEAGLEPEPADEEE